MYILWKINKTIVGFARWNIVIGLIRGDTTTIANGDCGHIGLLLAEDQLSSY